MFLFLKIRGSKNDRETYFQTGVSFGVVDRHRNISQPPRVSLKFFRVFEISHSIVIKCYDHHHPIKDVEVVKTVNRQHRPIRGEKLNEFSLLTEDDTSIFETKHQRSFDFVRTQTCAAHSRRITRSQAT